MWKPTHRNCSCTGIGVGDPHHRTQIGRVGFPAAVLVAALVAVGAYANHFQNGFHFDDSHVIEDNLAIRSLGNAPRILTDATAFSTLPAHQTYRPLLTLSYALDYRIAGGLDPMAFHVTQLFLHLLVGAGLVLLFQRVMDAAEPGLANRYLALLGGLLFCVHTANTETVDYLSCRSDVLSTLGVVASFLVYLDWPRSRGLYLYLLPMLLGVLAKPPAAVFAPLLLVYALLFEEELAFADVLTRKGAAKLGCALARTAPALVVALLAVVFVEGMNPRGQSYGGAEPLDYLRTQAWVWLRYLRLFAVPSGLTADSDWRVIPAWTDARVLAGACGIGALLWAAFRASGVREWRPVAFGLAWFVLGLLPSSSVFPLAEVTNEHRIYLPFAGLILAATWGAARVARKRRGRAPALRVPLAWAACAALLVATHVAGTLARNRVWRSEETLWADVVDKSPRNGRAWMNYGLTQMEQGRLEKARALFLQAAELSPHYAPLLVNLGIAAHSLGDTAGADAYFARALAERPDYPAGHYFYARYLVEAGRAPEAIEQLREALAESPSYLAPRRLLLQLYYVIGSRVEVERLASGILNWAPDDADARGYLADRPPVPAAGSDAYEQGVALTGQGRHLEAGVAYRRHLAEARDDADAYNNLGWSQAQLGLDALAAASFAQAAALQPDDDYPRRNLAWIRERMAMQGAETTF